MVAARDRNRTLLERLPESDGELGITLKRLRGGLTQTDVARAGGVSKSTVSRWETGQGEITLVAAERLDNFFETTPRLQYAVLNLRRGQDEALQLQAGESILKFPRRFIGQVWIAVRPNPDFINLEHTVEFFWGPHTFSDSRPLEVGGTAFVTGKFKPDQVGLYVRTDPPVYEITHGTDGPPSGFFQLDIRHAWLG
ncbi:helix-turn-helix domain-containing protein [Naasia lichenicola]|uniref:Helix-turn-helix domain-containing protein n=1 Tax=Naasia lichenicola TaxID=2565933 RepID=A0A4S4FTU0_9MICO|nr:helix-turn-helix transcriptional regulator [Naasia lichenicola]THG33006.1 helix-turn-helix domain-containing protein [Naasia lichenicola]